MRESIGATGFEPATSWSQTTRSTKLSYAPGHCVMVIMGAARAHVKFSDLSPRRPLYQAKLRPGALFGVISTHPNRLHFAISKIARDCQSSFSRLVAENC